MKNLQSITTALTSAATLLNTEEAIPEAQLLLQHVLNVNRAWLISHQNDALQPNVHADYRALINRRVKGEPIAYILGYREFYGLKLKVTPATLIPRPDTETLVDAALAKIPQNVQTLSFRREQFVKLRATESIHHETDSDLRQNDTVRNDEGEELALKILDLGTGSGAIALAIAKHRPQAFVTAVDASDSALKIALENAQNLQITNIKFEQSNWFGALQQENSIQTFDVIVSNPPYIEQNDSHLKQGDLRFEPTSALTSGQDGLDDIRNIVSQAQQHLNPHGWLLLEHGYNQATSVTGLLKQAGFREIETIKDLGGNARVTLGILTT